MEPPGGSVDFLSMKIDSNAATRTGPNKKGAAAPRVGAAVFFQPCAQPDPGGPGPPYCISSFQEISYPPVFLKRKPADHPGCLWGHPLSVSLLRSERLVPNVFSTRRKDVAAHSISFSAGCRMVCADKPKSRFIQVWPDGHLLSSHEERRQRRAKGVPPLGAPGGFVDFLSMKIDSDAGPSSRPYKKGCGPGDGLPHFFSPAPNRSPEASGSLVV